MADTYTTNLNLTKPEPGAAEDTWGISLNADLDSLDAIFGSGGTAVSMGAVTLDGLTVEQSTSPTITINDTDSALPLTIKQDGANASMLLGSAGVLTLGVTNNSNLSTVILQTQSKSRLNIASNGDISFYDDTGTSQNLKWDASADSLNFVDNAKATFGNSDLQIYHTGTTSFIANGGNGSLRLTNGTGNIELRASTVALQDNSAYNYLRTEDLGNGGRVRIYHEAVEVMKTNSTGIDVTGTLNVSEDVLLGSNGRIRVGSVGSLSSPTIYLDTDPNTGIYFPSVDSLGFVAGGTERLTVNSTGIDVTGTVTSDGLTVDSGSSDINIVFDDDSVTNRYKFTTGGNSLDSFFDVSSGSSRASHIRTISGSVSFDIASGFSRNDINFSNADLFIKRSGTKALEVDHGTGDISFYDDTGSTQGLFWDASDESLGIGTTSPSSTLHLRDTTAQIKINSDNGQSAYLTFGDANDTTRGGLEYTSTDDLKFQTNNMVDQMVINSSGNVGIGTNSPSKKLEVAGNIGTSNGSGTIYNQFANAGNDVIWENRQNGNIIIRSNNSTERLRINTSGSVGIGTSSPSEKLTVDGDGTFKNTTDATGATLKVADNANRGITITSPIAAGAAAGRVAVTGTSNSLEIGVRDYPTALKIEGGSGNALFSSSVTVSKTSSGNIMQVASLVNPVGVANTGVRLWMSGKNTTDRGTFIDAVAESTSNNHTLRFGTSASASAPVEAMRIDSSQNLLVGTTSSTPAQQSSVTGVSLRTTGAIETAADSGNAARFNRLTSDGSIVEFRKDGTKVGSIGSSFGNRLYIGDGDTAIRFADDLDTIVPWNASTNTLRDNAIDLGESSGRFQDIYATNGTIQTSDINEKQDIEELSEAETRVAVAAKGLLKKYRWKSAVADKGDDARIHFGIMAQDLQQAFSAEGLDAGDYGMFISSTWTDETTGEEKTRLGVRYNELLAFIIAAI